MRQTLLTTKLYFPPVRSSLVPRPHLVERLKVGLSGPLTLIAAPAGYGKTTLMGEWRAAVGRGTHVAWLSLDEGDNDLGRFSVYLTAALDNVQPGLAEDTRLLLQSPQLPTIEEICTALINELNGYPGDLVLVLDDYHMVTLPEIHQILAFLLDHLPPSLHLVILTRSDPPLPLARLRARNQLVEIRAADLRFTIEETITFLAEIMGLNLSLQEAAVLEARTEGWIAGLQLVALSMQGREDVEGFIAAFSGSHRYIVDYLAEEVLNRQSKEVRDFLLQTSILDRLTGHLCDALTGSDSGQSMMESLARSNLFLIPLDDERRWYRYHHLFADLLRSRLQADYPDQLIELHHRAARWCESMGEIREAVKHSLAGKDYDFVARVIIEQGIRLARENNLNDLLHWMDALPASYWETDAELNIVRIYLLWTLRKVEEVERSLVRVERILERERLSQPEIVHTKKYRLADSSASSMRSRVLFSRGELDASIEISNRTLEMAPEDADLLRALTYSTLYMAYRNICKFDEAIRMGERAIHFCKRAEHHVLAIDATANLASMYVVRGNLRRAQQTIQDGFDYLDSLDQKNLPSYSILSDVKARILFLKNDLDTALSVINEALRLSEKSGRPSNLQHNLLVKAEITYARGENQETIRILENLKKFMAAAGEFQDHEINFHAEWMLAKIEAESGNFAPALELIDAAASHNHAEGIVIACREELYIAYLLVLLNRLVEAQTALDQLASKVTEFGLSGWLIEIFVLQSLVWQKRGQMDQALIALEKALKIASPENNMHFFLSAGKHMPELLHLARTRGIEPEFVTKLLSASTSISDAGPAVHSDKSPLSKRELELLVLIAAGLTNKEIAHQLYISIGTVKRHTVNIFTKLDVKNRTEAVAKARVLGLL